MYELAGKRVYVCGHTGMVGSALLRRLQRENCTLVTATRAQVDLTRQDHVEGFFAREQPDAVFLAAGKVGGIAANNTLRAEFIRDNLMIVGNVIHAAWESGVEKLLNLGSTCIYPRLAPQPMPESALLTGPLDPTNEPYAIAKIAAVKMCQAYRDQYGCSFISVMPTNLYGPGDNYHPEHSHLVGALLRRFHEAKVSEARSVIVWGSGTPRREFLYVDDLAEACLFAMRNYDDSEILNIGYGEDVTVLDFAKLVAQVVGFEGSIELDTERPDGPPRKLVDSSRMTQLGWRPTTRLKDGLKLAYADFVARYADQTFRANAR
ncbi:GDP-L-fucose synthase family protein [Tepidamorphus sp. 3E244]|uniref:GDP-L-fucose synthase family protein n=1 Tax=Tepidamorphus sp. 3E244 TaxID=3385498 RepID=UPI0038FC5F2A